MWGIKSAVIIEKAVHPLDHEKVLIIREITVGHDALPARIALKIEWTIEVTAAAAVHWEIRCRHVKQACYHSHVLTAALERRIDPR
jgi:hypothetical protein